MGDLRQFGKRAKVLGQAIEDNTNKLVRRVAVAVDSTLVLSTPVDTGRARANWIVNLGAPNDGTTTAVSPSGSESLAAAKSTIEKRQPGQDIHITNNLDYIGALNDGWSAQAPANFVEKAVMDGAAMVKGAKILVDKPGIGE